MKASQIFHSKTGAASAQFLPLGNGKTIVFLFVPVGAGRRARLEIGIGQARATHEALTHVLNEIDRQFGLREGE